MAAEQHVSRKQLLFSILRELENLYSDLKTNGRASVFNKWHALCKTPGTFVDVSTPRGIIRGYAVDVSETGELLIKPEAEDIQKITAGDVAM